MCAEQLHSLSCSAPGAPPVADTLRRIEYAERACQATAIPDRQLIELKERRELPAGRAGAQFRQDLQESPSIRTVVVLVEYVETQHHHRRTCDRGQVFSDLRIQLAHHVEALLRGKAGIGLAKKDRQHASRGLGVRSHRTEELFSRAEMPRLQEG